MPHSAFLSHRFKIGGDLLKVRILCQHDYYKGAVCPDLVFELPPDSKELLRRNGIFYKEKGHILEFAREKKKIDDNKFSTDLPKSPINILVHVNNPRFCLVTDFEAYKGNDDDAGPRLFELEKNGESIQFSHKKEGEAKRKYGSLYAILDLDLSKIGNAEKLVLPFKARRVTLKYMVHFKQNLFEDLLKVSELKEGVKEEGIKLKVESKDEKVCVLISTEKWALREENLHKNKGYLEFKVDDLKLYLPFPGRITSQTIKKDTIEQEVRLPRVE